MRPLMLNCYRRSSRDCVTATLTRSSARMAQYEAVTRGLARRAEQDGPSTRRGTRLAQGHFFALREKWLPMAPRKPGSLQENREHAGLGPATSLLVGKPGASPASTRKEDIISLHPTRAGPEQEVLNFRARRRASLAARAPDTVSYPLMTPPDAEPARLPP
jgi:hypothetical protein